MNQTENPYKLIFFTYENGVISLNSEYSHNGGYSVYRYNIDNGLCYLDTNHNEINSLGDWSSVSLSENHYLYKHSKTNETIVIKYHGEMVYLASTDELNLVKGMLDILSKKINEKFLDYREMEKILFYKGHDGILDMILDIINKLFNQVKTSGEQVGTVKH